jgi:hypothetical protein
LRDLIDAGLVAQSLEGGTASAHRFEIRVSGDVHEIVATPVKKDDTQGLIAQA